MPGYTNLLSDITRDRRSLGLLIAPSWLSGTVAVVGALAVVVTAAIAVRLPRSEVWELFQSQRDNDVSVSNNYETVSQGFAANEFISNLPLFVFWACIGLLVYSFVINIVNSFSNALNLKKEMEFVHADRHKLARTALWRLGFRLLVLVILILFLRLTLNLVLPYSVASTQYAMGSPGLINTILYLGLAFVIMAVCLHILTVLLRLLRLRPRLFGQV